MPSANKVTTPLAISEPIIEGSYAELDDYTVAIETFSDDIDPAAYFAGRPDDRCSCPHWGVVVSGQITFRWPDRERWGGRPRPMMMSRVNLCSSLLRRRSVPGRRRG